MVKLSGDAAEARLARAWETILSQDPAGQEIIHVLAQPPVRPSWLADFRPFSAWLRNDCQADAGIWRSFAEIAESWPYIINARRAAARGIPNVRMIVMRDDLRESMPPWLRYLSEVHLPAISALSREKLFRVWAEDCRESGLPVRDYDSNLFGAAGVMIAGGENGNIEWRAFLEETQDPDQFRQEHEYVTSMRDLALHHGDPIALPPALSTSRARK